ncbi:MAG: hypothetical protein ETSY2_47930 [Candidatus Entotheonella gemina]|uniref:t-SNARE coiled-coil homology domain-containing protein n=1 Tax=Candidatus Entotheonella gemina TaxID=1429439 RepID=W4LE23_9BACT|nr:MAG: hypothetical protein ETSY2_47930 [Candidatus Entotheonella gemina]
MAEDFVSRDQHRADMAELRGELKEEIAGLRQDMTAMRGELREEIAGVRHEITVLTKTIEANQQTMLLRFEQVDRQLEQVNRQFGQVDRQFGRHETRLVSLENWMRATFVTVALVAVGVAVQLFYTFLRFGLKPPTP